MLEQVNRKVLIGAMAALSLAGAAGTAVAAGIHHAPPAAKVADRPEPGDTPDQAADTPDQAMDTPDQAADTPEPGDTPDQPVDTPDQAVDIPEPGDTPDEIAGQRR